MGGKGETIGKPNILFPNCEHGPHLPFQSNSSSGMNAPAPSKLLLITASVRQPSKPQPSLAMLNHSSRNAVKRPVKARQASDVNLYYPSPENARMGILGRSKWILGRALP